MNKLFLPTYLDSDVIISSLLSETGAASALTGSDHIIRYISNYSVLELDAVCARLKIEKSRLDQLIKTRLELVDIKGEDIHTSAKYTSDDGDRHIVAGARKSGSKYLITYNMKHYHTDLLKNDFGIITFTPAQMLQFLRSKE